MLTFSPYICSVYNKKRESVYLNIAREIFQEDSKSTLFLTSEITSSQYNRNYLSEQLSISFLLYQNPDMISTLFTRLQKENARYLTVKFDSYWYCFFMYNSFWCIISSTRNLNLTSYNPCLSGLSCPVF